MKIRKTVMSFILATSLSYCSLASASGIPTVDVASLTQDLMTFTQQIEQMKKDYEMFSDQLEKMKQQYSELQNIKGNLSGINSFANAFDSLMSSIDTVSDLQSYISSVSNDDINYYQNQSLCTYKDEQLKSLCLKQNELKDKKINKQFKTLKDLIELLPNTVRVYNKAKQAKSAKEIADATAALNYQQALIQSKIAEEEIMKKNLDKDIELKDHQINEIIKKRFSSVSDQELHDGYYIW